ncbi:MAG: transcription-repair coupling factor [Gammaproteobacteria bacterium]|nr:transcription-repair coupling factor [Gammaproteobacteria bacterium]
MIPFPGSTPTKPGERQTWSTLYGAAVGLAIASVAKTQPVCVITPDTLTASRLEDELNFFTKDDAISILHLPDWETLPYDRFSPHQDIISGRLEAFHYLPKMQQGAIITPISTWMHRVPPIQYLEQYTFLLTLGDKLNLDATRLRLEKSGYHCVSQVREHGEFAIRGSIIDLFPMGSSLPYRIDLFDDEVDSIRTFSPDTQRSLDKIERIRLLPAREFPFNEQSIEFFRQQWRAQFSGNPLNCPLYQDVTEGICSAGLEYYLPLFFEKTALLSEYLPNNILLIHVGDTHASAEHFWKDIGERYDIHANDISRPLLSPEQMFVPVPEVFQVMREYPAVQVSNALKNPFPDLSIEPKAESPFHKLQKFMAEWDGRILFSAETSGRREILRTQLASLSVYPENISSWQNFLIDSHRIGLIVGSLEQGFCLSDPNIALIAEAQLSGERIMQRRRRKETPQDTDAIIRNLAELQIGSPVVHIDHGVGRYLGLQTLEIGGKSGEFLQLEYADDDRLYVPVASLHLVSRYSGMDPDHAPLNKLGTGHWQRARKKALEDMRDVAAELLDIYAKRAASKGFVNQALEQDYATFAAGFPFEETPDQQKAIDEVIKDMQSPHPMDRLVCGDVGFGKTEVAMRAAFIAVQSGKQVAVLVPTTLLANQHYQNFIDRFADWPFRIEVLSRFKTSNEQTKMLGQLEQGKIDIIIGTHRLLQKNIRFQNLGLVVIDEEHRFGVHQKEHLKMLRLNVDILALTATPIPRTLNMAFAGIRDLSIIATPPQRRLSVKTFVQEYQANVIQEAILREILRGGQVYFLHNDVSTIDRMARELEQLVPEARVSIAHGQMRERELEKIMSDFYHRRFNVLVCSTIIESGIDVPSANTIVINRADKLGLAQLHQLRGRVGRSHHQAYAWLLVPSFKTITSDANKRLDAITSLEDLGAGFTLATHDLEIRGAGELLGDEQSGNMQAIGFTLYMDMLTRAVNALREGKDIQEEYTYPHGAEIELNLSALIPEPYLSDVQLRLQFYRRIATTKTSSELDEIQVEMIDRFGLLPPPAKTLFAQSLIRQKAESLGIARIEASASGGKITFTEKPLVEPLRIIQLIQQRHSPFRFDGPECLRFTLEQHEPNQRIQLIEKIIETLGEPCQTNSLH